MAKLADVARMAKVSVATASKVLAQGKEAGRIGEDAARRVREAAERLQYRGNYHARSLLTGRSQTLGLALPMRGPHELGGGFWSHSIGGVSFRARQLGYDFLLIGPVAEEGDELRRGLQFLGEGRIDALVAPGWTGLWKGEPDAASLDARIVLLEYYRPTRLPVVQMDPAPGIAAAVAHLAALGHREMLWTGWRVRGQEVAPERRSAFRACLAESGLRGRETLFDEPEGFTPSTAAMIELSAQLWREELRRAAAPTAVFAFNELNALGLYEALRERGLRVPEDVSVIGWDRLHDQYARPMLSTIGLMLPECGARAAEWAVDLAEGRETPQSLRGRVARVGAEFTVQASTGPARER
ncbi:MAG: LacI family DNA-binding transcriptional regulator [Planctomycetes bacterium]|nr:LacI family DNA-binding transcriptional regulator [Planctomycetota bacterium]